MNYSHRKDCKQMRKLMLKPQKQMLTTTAMMATISTLAMMALMVLVLVPMLMLMAV